MGSSIWSSFLDKNYSYFLSEDFALEDFLFWFFFYKKKNALHYNDIMVNRFFIYRSFNKLFLKIHFISFGNNENQFITSFFNLLSKNFTFKSRRLEYLRKYKKKESFYSSKVIFLRFFYLNVYVRFLEKNKIKISKKYFYS